MASLYEVYSTGDDGSYAMYGKYWDAQTFTVGATGHTVTSVKLKLYRKGSPGTVTVSIRATSGDHPTGADLTVGTIDGNSLTTATAGAWYEIALTEYTLNASTKYAIVVRAPNGSTNNYLYWRADKTSPTYTGGNREDSIDNGVTWTTTTLSDFMFEVWGNPAGGPITGWRKLQYYTEPPSTGAFNQLKFASEPPVSGAFNKLLYEGE